MKSFIKALAIFAAVAATSAHADEQSAKLAACRDAAVYAADAADLATPGKLTHEQIIAAMEYKFAYVAGTSKEALFRKAVNYGLKVERQSQYVQRVTYIACKHDVL